MACLRKIIHLVNKRPASAYSCLLCLSPWDKPVLMIIIVNPVFCKSGKGMNFILKHQTEKPNTKLMSQIAAQETQISTLFERQENFLTHVKMLANHLSVVHFKKIILTYIISALNLLKTFKLMVKHKVKINLQSWWYWQICQNNIDYD